MTVATAFPGTPFYDRLKGEGRILQDGAWETCTLFDINFVPEGMSVSELETGFRTLVQRLYSEEETLERHARFKQRLRRAARREHMRWDRVA